MLQEQEAAIKAIDQDIDFVILELRWDECHVELAIIDSPLAPGLPSEGTVAGFFPLVMKKGSIIYRTRNGRTHIEPLILAPVVLRESCSADELWRALEQKMSSAAKDLLQRAEYTGILLGHDSHRASFVMITLDWPPKAPGSSLCLRVAPCISCICA